MVESRPEKVYNKEKLTKPGPDVIKRFICFRVLAAQLSMEFQLPSHNPKIMNLLSNNEIIKKWFLLSNSQKLYSSC